MTSVDLAAAQQRVLDRRQARALASQARAQVRRSQYALELSSRLPFPLDSWSQKGIGAWDTIKGRDGTRPAFRVGQVDAELLDEELLELLKIQVGEALKYFGSHLRDEWSSEILLALRAALFKLSIWDHNASYGAALQNLQYTDARQTGPLLPTPTHWQKAWYGLLSVGGRYGWEKWNIWLADREGSYEPVGILCLCPELANPSKSPHPLFQACPGSPLPSRLLTPLLRSRRSSYSLSMADIERSSIASYAFGWPRQRTTSADR